MQLVEVLYIYAENNLWEKTKNHGANADSFESAV